MATLQQAHSYPFLQGGGEMGALTRNFDWSTTSVGVPDQWPQSLRTTVSNILRSRFPMFLWWGPDMIQFYNDAYRPSMGVDGKHPSALGSSGPGTWKEIWPIVSPLMLQVETTGEATWMENQLVPIYRNGKLEDVYWTYSYSSVLDDDGKHAGILVTCMETTEQVLAQQQVEKSQQELLVLFEESPVAIANIRNDEALHFEFANTFYGVVVGRKPEELIGRPLLDAIPEIRGQGFDELLRKVIRTGEPFIASEVAVNIQRSGVLETRYVDLTYQPRRDVDGSVSGVLVVATDVTQQVLARQKTEESVLYAKSLFYNSPVALLVYVGEEMVLREANEKMLTVFGRGDEIIGKPLTEAVPELKDTPLMDHYLEVLKTGETHIGYAEQILLVKNGEPHVGYYDYTFKALDDTTGKRYGVICTVIEVTEQEMARQILAEKEIALENALEQVRLSKEAAELGTFDMNMQNGAMHWDDRCRLLFGISHHKPVSYERDFIQRLHPDDQERVLAVVSRAFDKRASDGDYDVDYRTIGADDGVVRWVRAKGKVYFDKLEKPLRFIGSVLDISEQKTAIQKIEALVDERTKELATVNESLQAINKELQRSNRNLEEFAHAASHDLKEPVRKIQFFSNKLKEQLSDHLSEMEVHSFSRIENATQRMGNLIDDLLLYSHVSDRPRETEAIDLNEKVKRVLEDLDLDIEERKATVNVTSLPTVNGYRRQLQQLFQNLISNAIKYSKEDTPPVIEIAAQKVERAGNDYHLVSIKDNGIGFAQEYNEKIFQMFARLHGRAEYSGTGVGLSIVKKVVENHNGFIEVESEVHKGSVFKIYLPV